MAVIAASVGLLDLNPLAAQAEPNANRSFSPDPVDAGGEVTVTITAEGYGAFGDVVETLPAGFTYLSSDLPDGNVTDAGQTVTLSLIGTTSPTTFTYTITASSAEGDYSFTGVFSGVDANFDAFSGVQVRGDSSITVAATTTPPAPEPTANRSFSPDPVDAGGEVTVTITAEGYGAFGDVVETLPAGFTYLSSDLPDGNVTDAGQTVTLSLIGTTSPTTFTYTITASSAEGDYSFTGVFSGVDANFDAFSGVQVRGDSSITVAATTTPPAPEPTANRSFSPDPVDAGGEVTVTITAEGYGAFGDVVETLPAGFTYLSSDLPDGNVTDAGQTVTLSLIGTTSPTTFTYTITASSAEGDYSFTGVFSGVDANFDAFSGVQVRGDSSITVGVVAPEPEPQVNRAPAFSRSSTTRPIVENSASGANVGALVRATDADGDRLTYSLTGTDAGSFTINSGTGQIMVGAGTTLDYETKASYMVSVTATDPAGDSDSIVVTITVTNVVELGMVSGEASVSYAENDEDTVATYTASGAMADDAMWTLMGDDEAHFTITGGMLKFRSAPDYEMPRGMAMSDTNTNTYMVTVKAEAGGEMAMMVVEVMVTNVDEEGTVTLSSMTPVVGVELTATLADPDMVTEDTVTWQWSKSMTMDGTSEDIDGATMMTYTPVAADDGYYLMAEAMYTDGHGPGKSAMKTTANMVTAGDPLIVRYDTNENGQIDKSEVITAINDYLFGEGNEAISKADVIRLINLYLFG